MVRRLQKLSKLIGLYLLCDGDDVSALSNDAASDIAFGPLVDMEGFGNPSSSFRNSFILLFCGFSSKGVDNDNSSECR